MANGDRGPLGQRIAGWANDFLSNLGLAQIVDRFWSDKDTWDNIRSVDDLKRFLADGGKASPLEVMEKAQSVGATPEQIRDMLDPGFEEIRADPSAWIGNQIQAAFSDPRWVELNEIMGAAAIDPFLATLVAGQLDPSAPEIDRVRRFLGTVSTFETLGSLISTVVETLSAGQIDNAGRFLTDLKWSLGICFTSWQSTSPIIEATVLKPLQKLIDATFRPADFTRSQWMDLHALGKISATRLGEELARQGYSEDKIGWLLDLAEKQPSRSDLLRMWEKGIIGPELFADGLRRDGYGSEWIDRFMRMYQVEETTEEKGAYLGTLRKAFKEQMIGESEFRAALKSQNRSDEAIDLEIAVLKLSWEVEEKTAAKADIKAAYMADTIGTPEAARWLAEAGFAQHTIDLLLETWQRERAPSYKQINKSEILKAWGVGVLSRPEAYRALLNVGYNENGATVLMETYERTHLATKPPEPYQLKTTDIMWAWHTTVIELDEAIERLVRIGLTEEDAELYSETFQRLHPRITAAEPKELQKSDILDAYGRGVIEEEGAFERLVNIGYTDEDAGFLIASYQARPEALPPEPTINQLISATRRGVITAADLSQKLTVLGLSEESVQFYVSYATTPLPETTRSLSRSDITKLWSLGRHDRAWSLERLLALNYSPEDAEDILWLASPDIRDTETYVLWVLGVIDDDVAAAMWASMGFTPEQINEVLTAGA